MSADFFRAVESAYLEAQKSEMVRTNNYRLAGQSVQIEIAGSALADHIQPAFSHLKSDPASPSFQVFLWDANASGVPCPPGIPAAKRSDEWTSPTQAFAYGFDRRYVEYRSHAGTTWLDRATKRFYGCYGNARDFTVYDVSRPLPWLLPVWCNDLGILSVHAGMVSWEGSGVLIAGKSGSGKTTATLACLNGGFDYLAEDQTGISEHANQFEGFSFYNTARVEENHLHRFPSLAPYARREEGQKTLLMLSELFPGQFASQASVRLLVLPRIVSSEKTNIDRASAAEALRTIAANSLMLPMGGGKRGFERLGRLVRHVPCYWLNMGSDISAIPDAIRGALPS